MKDEFMFELLTDPNTYTKDMFQMHSPAQPRNADPIPRDRTPPNWPRSNLSFPTTPTALLETAREPMDEEPSKDHPQQSTPSNPETWGPNQNVPRTHLTAPEKTLTLNTIPPDRQKPWLDVYPTELWAIETM